MTKKIRTFLFPKSATVLFLIVFISGIGNNLSAQDTKLPASKEQLQPLQSVKNIYSFTGNMNWQTFYFPGFQSGELEQSSQTELQLEFRNINMLSSHFGLGYKFFSSVSMSGFLEGFVLRGIGAGPLLRYYPLENTRWQPYLQGNFTAGYNLALTSELGVSYVQGFRFQNSLKAGLGYKFSNAFGLFLEAGPGWGYTEKLQLDSHALFINVGIELYRFSHSPSYAKEEQAVKPKQSFIEKGTFLSGFSFSFLNSSREKFNQDVAREVTRISFQADGLYFVSDRVGIGPLFSYGFTYRDLFNVVFPPDDIDQRRSSWVGGIEAGYYIPVNKVFGKGNSYLFLDGGPFVQHVSLKRENSFGSDNREFGYQIGTGILIPLGKQIAINTRLGFQSFRREYKFANRQNDLMTKTRWPKEISLSVGLNVTF